MTTIPFKVPGIADLRAVRFNFGGDGGVFSNEFDGYTDGTTWNGWLNVYVKLETYRDQIRPLMVGEAGLGFDETVEDLDGIAAEAEKNGTLVSLAGGFTTAEVTPPVVDEDKQAEILGDLIHDEPTDCPMCGGDAYLLGTLGTIKHFRCRDCGWTFPS